MFDFYGTKWNSNPESIFEVKLYIWSSTSATKPIKLEYFIHINVAGLWLKTVLQNRTPGELLLEHVVLVKTTMDLLSDAMEWLTLREDREVGTVQWLSCCAITWTISVLQVYGNVLVLSLSSGVCFKAKFGVVIMEIVFHSSASQGSVCLRAIKQSQL